MELDNKLKFLINKFNITPSIDLELEYTDSGNSETSDVIFFKEKNRVLGLKTILLPTRERKRIKYDIKISEEVLGDILQSDPTEHKIFAQWMLTMLVRLIKEGNYKTAKQFIFEDLTMANEYLTLFEENKKKKRFKEYANKLHYNNWLSNNPNGSQAEWKALRYNPTDINQYQYLHQVFDVIHPFIPRTPSVLEQQMNKYVAFGEAEIPVSDRNWTVYIPKTKAASIIFKDFAGWCTANPELTNYESYKTGNPKPDGTQSDYYIIVNNKLFTGETDECYQIHFETLQMKSRKNEMSGEVDIYNLVLKDSQTLLDYFICELNKLIKMCGKITEPAQNKYIKQLVRFGVPDALFEYLDDRIPIINFKDEPIPKLPDLSRFKSLEQLLVSNTSLTTLPETIGENDRLEMLSLMDNKITHLPSSIGKLKDLQFLNLKHNPLISIPDEITYLDKSNGGSLVFLKISDNMVSVDLINKLKKLLPKTIIN